MIYTLKLKKNTLLRLSKKSKEKCFLDLYFNLGSLLTPGKSVKNL
jgi:hypothetical protein